jgi:hypothetical protein
LLAEILIENAEDHLTIHHANSDGWITLARKEENHFRQYHYKYKDVFAELPKWSGNDVFHSQNTFFQPVRRIENIRQLLANYVDIDFYQKGLNKEWVLGHIKMLADDDEIPKPNYIIHSGRGIVLIWFINPAPIQALPLWNVLQDYLYKKLKHLGADNKALDASRVFRVAGTKNSKNGAVVEVEKWHEERTDLKELKRLYLPELQKAVSKKKSKRGSRVSHLYNTYTLHLARLQDLVTLVKLRNYDMKGYREMTLFYYRYLKCCVLHDKERALEESLSFNNEFLEPLPLREVKNATKSAEKAHKARFDKKANEIARLQGYKWAGFNPSNKKLIEWFDITPEEQIHMKTIISKTEKQRRNTIYQREKRRKRGEEKRSVYLEQQQKQTTDKLSTLKKLLEANPKTSNVQLAEILGISESYVRKLKKKL